MGVTAHLAAKGYKIDPEKVAFQAYVVSLPEGKPGSRHWTERWIFTLKGKEVPVTIDFRESGLGAADYTVRK